MASLRPAFTQLRGRCQTSAPQWQQVQHMLQGIHISPKARHTRPPPTFRYYTDDSISRRGETDADARESREVEAGGMLNKLIANLNVGEEANGQRNFNRPQGRMGDMLAGGDGHAVGWNQMQQMEDLPAGGSASFDDDAFAQEEEEDDEEEPKPESTIHARPMPVSPSYFTRSSEFNDCFLVLQKLMRKYGHLPTAPSDQIKRVAFRSIKDYRLAVGEIIKSSAYAKCINLAKRLHKIHPMLAPPSIADAIAPFTRDINPYNQKLKDIPIDKFGRTLGVGKRKTSVARAWVVEGMGEVLVNGKSLADAFGRVHDRESAVWALKATARTDKYNVWALVEGGGTTGQAEALAMAVGKALMAHEPALKPALRRAGVVTRDPRGVERKKTGHLKARKKPAWVKR